MTIAIALLQNVLKILIPFVEEETVSLKDDLGQTPLHALCSRGANASALQMLLEKSSSSSCEVDNEGRIPLHCALDRPSYDSYYYTDEKIVYCLLEAFPLGAYAADNNGVTPLQIAHENDVHLGIIYNLVKVDPIKSLFALGFQPRSGSALA